MCSETRASQTVSQRPAAAAVARRTSGSHVGLRAERVAEMSGADRLSRDHRKEGVACSMGGMGV